MKANVYTQICKQRATRIASLIKLQNNVIYPTAKRIYTHTHVQALLPFFVARYKYKTKKRTPENVYLSSAGEDEIGKFTIKRREIEKREETSLNFAFWKQWEEKEPRIIEFYSCQEKLMWLSSKNADALREIDCAFYFILFRCCCHSRDWDFGMCVCVRVEWMEPKENDKKNCKDEK